MAVHVIASKVHSQDARRIAATLVARINPAATGAIVLVPGAAAAALPQTYALLGSSTAVLAAMSSRCRMRGAGTLALNLLLEHVANFGKLC